MPVSVVMVASGLIRVSGLHTVFSRELDPDSGIYDAKLLTKNMMLYTVRQPVRYPHPAGCMPDSIPSSLAGMAL